MVKISLPRKIERERRIVELSLPEGDYEDLERIAFDQGYIYRNKPAVGQFLSEVVTKSIITQEPSTEE